jgi:Rrf2 family protein
VVITREADYAVRLMVTLAGHGYGTVASARSLAQDCDVPYELARTILGSLADAGVLDSRRGRSGGFALKRPPAQIMLGEVLGAVGESLQLNVCVDEPGNCSRSGVCPVHPVWRSASDVLRGFLSSQTLADMVEQGKTEAAC